MGQNSAPGTLRRNGGGRAGSRPPRRGLEACGEPGRLAISVFVGPLSAHLWSAWCGPSPPTAGRCGTAVCRCRVSRSVAHLFVKRQGRFAAGPAWLVKVPRAGSDGRMYLLRHRRFYTDSSSRAATCKYTAGPWDSGRVSRGAWQLVLALARIWRWSTPPQSRQAMARHHGRPSCSAASLITPPGRRLLSGVGSAR